MQSSAHSSRKSSAGVVGPSRVRRWIALLAFLFGLFEAAAADPEPSEYQVKAAFLFNFAKFVDWPARKSGETNTPMVIGVLGVDPFGALLEETVKDQNIGGRRLVIRALSTADEAGDCHVLFISRSERNRLKPLLASLKGKAVLTVSESKGFAQEGGMINLVVLNGSVKLEINPAAAEEAGLKISSKLLSLARIIKSSER